MSEAKFTLSGYRIQQDGRVFSTDSNWRGYGEREMVPAPNSSGYPSVRLTLNGKRKKYPVHVLVALTFLPPKPSPLHQIRHLDGDKNNPHKDNLAWGTAKDNADDRTRHGTALRGLRHKALTHMPRILAFRRRAWLRQLEALK